MAHPHPVTEPARRRLERHICSQWLAFGARRLSRAVVGDRDDAMEQRKEAVVLIECRQQVGDGQEGGKPDAPAVAMSRPVEQGVARKLLGRYAHGGRAKHRLADDQADIVGKAVMQAPPPMRRLVARRGRGRHPDLAINEANRAYRHVVCPEIEGTATA